MAKFYSKASLALSVIIGLGTSSHLYADDGVTWADIENDAKTPENVLMYASLTTSLVLSTNSLFLICVGPLLSIMNNT